MCHTKHLTASTQAAVVGLSVFAIYLSMTAPTLAANIDLSPVQQFLDSIVKSLTGPLGKTAATLAIVASLLTWFFGIIDFRQLLWIVVAIVCIGSAPTIVSSLWAGA
ncbi:TrbC/VirB2 family protein [Brucella pseudogrignonensis]